MTSSETVEFFKKHKIPIQLTIDAKGTGATKQLKDNMKQLRLGFAYNTVPCLKGHTIKTRHGHCPVCDTAKVSFELRALQYGVLYIAGSINGKLIKIGCANKPELRENSLNKTKYSNFDDWKILWSGNCINVGAIESKTQLLLKKYGYIGKYNHDGHLQESHETFKCNYADAYNAIIEIKKSLVVNFINPHERTYIIAKYQFKR